MPATFLEESIAILERTPATLDALLRELPDAWIRATEGPGTWSPYVVLGHLIQAERADWMPRLAIIREHGTSRSFEPFVREPEPDTEPLSALLDQFAMLRRASLASLEALNLQPAQMAMQGSHPEFGPVTIRQLIATWTAHDLAHILQVSRVMAKRYKSEVGPWAQYLSVMR